MIQVLITDDEPRFRRFIETLVPWETYGFRIAGIAKNGVEALDKMKTIQSDIVFLDINMPRMDGLRLTEHLKLMYPDTIIVLVTGYSEFEYARRAIQLGVEEYLLKPFSAEELTALLFKLKTKILHRLEHEQKEKSHLAVVRSELWKQFLEGEDPPSEDTLHHLEETGIVLDGHTFWVAILELSLDNLGFDEGDAELLIYIVSNILDEMSALYGKHFLIPTYGNRMISIVNITKTTSPPAVSAFYEKIDKIFQRYKKQQLTVGISRPVKNPLDLPQAYQEAMVALQSKFLGSDNRIICYDTLISNGDTAGFYRMELNDQLLDALRRGDMKRINNILSATQQEIVSKKLSVDFAYTMILGILSLCLSYLAELGEDITRVLGRSPSPYQMVYSLSSVEECFAYLNDVFQKTESARKNQSSRSFEIVDQSLCYIREHLSDPNLSAEEVAGYLHLDLSYVRKVFSRRMNCSVIRCITMERMKKAVYLLEQGELSIGEIAEQIGYFDSGYFSKCFKKEFGISPSAYLRQLIVN